MQEHVILYLCVCVRVCACMIDIQVVGTLMAKQAIIKLMTGKPPRRQKCTL